MNIILRFLSTFNAFVFIYILTTPMSQMFKIGITLSTQFKIGYIDFTTFGDSNCSKKYPSHNIIGLYCYSYNLTHIQVLFTSSKHKKILFISFNTLCTYATTFLKNIFCKNKCASFKVKHFCGCLWNNHGPPFFSCKEAIKSNINKFSSLNTANMFFDITSLNFYHVLPGDCNLL